MSSLASSAPTQSVTLQLATFNIRNTTDRYEERLPHLREAITGLHADLAGFQEVNYVGGQPQMIADAMGMPLEHIHLGALPTVYPLKDHDPTFRIDGNLIAATGPAANVLRHDILRLSDHRIAHRVLIQLPSGARLSYVNTHMHHELDETDVREYQARLILDWAKSQDAHDGTVYSVVAGDFNTPPTEAAYSLIEAAGYTSCYKQVRGCEPERTFPSGLQAPTMDTDPPLTLDYIWIKVNNNNSSSGSHATASFEVTKCWLAANTPLATDPTIYPSDHIAVVANVTFS